MRNEDIFNYIQERQNMALEGEINEIEAYRELQEIESAAKLAKGKVSESALYQLDTLGGYDFGDKTAISTQRTTYKYDHIPEIVSAEKNLKRLKEDSRDALKTILEGKGEVIDGMFLDESTGELIPVADAKVTRFIKIDKNK